MVIAAQIATVLEPWQSVYANSTVLSTTILAVHVLALVIGGGLALANDRMTLRMAQRSDDARTVHLAELHAAHRIVIPALVALFISGVLMATADIEEFLASRVFWAKLFLIALLLVNGFLMRRAESRSDWPRLYRASRFSLVLWLTIATLGVVLVST
jgi:hypothetical protein